MKPLKQSDFKIELIKDLGMQFATPNSKKKSRFAIFKCKQCKKEVTKSVLSVKTGNSILCKSCRTINRNTTHNMSYSKYYYRWNNMKNRCYRKDDKHFQDYGGREITVCDEWRNDFESYFSYISKLDNAFKDGFSIDRINNDGNYEPDNIRWANATTQNFNKRIQKNNTSGIKGIHFDKRYSNYIPRITTGNRKRIELGRFKTIEDAKKCLYEYKQNLC